MYSVSIYSVQFTVYSVQCSVYCVPWTICSVRGTVYTDLLSLSNQDDFYFCITNRAQVYSKTISLSKWDQNFLKQKSRKCNWVATRQFFCWYFLVFLRIKQVDHLTIFVLSIEQSETWYNKKNILQNTCSPNDFRMDDKLKLGYTEKNVL